MWDLNNSTNLSEGIVRYVFDLNYVGFKFLSISHQFKRRVWFDLNYVGFKCNILFSQAPGRKRFDLNYVGFK